MLESPGVDVFVQSHFHVFSRDTADDCGSSRSVWFTHPKDCQRMRSIGARVKILGVAQRRCSCLWYCYRSHGRVLVVYLFSVADLLSVMCLWAYGNDRLMAAWQHERAC